MLFQIICTGIFGLFFLAISSKGFLTRKPVLLSNRWFFALFVTLLFPPILFIGFHTHGILSLNLMNGAMGATVLLVLWYLWKFYVNGYSVFGISDKSFRKALLQSLGQVKLKYTEDMMGIHIKSSNTTLKTSNFMGVGHIRPGGKGAPDLVKRLGPVLKKELAKTGVEFDIKPFLFYLVIGLMLLLIAFFQWSFQHNLG